MTISRYCEDCDVELDIDCSVTSSGMREEFHGAPVSWDEAEVEFESSTACPGCGREFDRDDLSEEAIELAAEYV